MHHYYIIIVHHYYIIISSGLVPEKHLGRTTKDLYPELCKLVRLDQIRSMSCFNFHSSQNQQYGINVCGEGGEYETFTLDCPLFHKEIVL